MLVQVQYVSTPERSASLWRYMDFTKLLSLLEYESLYFARADSFEDPYEGEWPAATARLFQGVGNTNALKIPDDLRRTHYISCWCASEHESAALWKLYLQSPEGVAVRTDVGALSDALEAIPQKITIAKVDYIDYESGGQIPWTRSLLPLFTRKRRSFEHEQEVRAIYYSPGGDAPGIAVPVSIRKIVKKVYVSPTAPRWFADLVDRAVRRYGLDTPIESSKLYQRAVH